MKRMMKKRRISFLAFLLALALLLTACAGQQSAEGDPASPEQEDASRHLTVRVGEAQTTLDPAAVTAQGGETVLYHLFENLLRWEDDGSGWAILASGQAESYTVEADYAGNATYTFTLREDIVWSDGEPVTAGQFVDAWRRLADPANGLPHRELLSVVSGYEEAEAAGDPTLLAVSAPDDRTLTVTLVGSPAWFLAEVCGGAYTMPIRTDLNDNQSAAVTNGAYTAASLDSGGITLERSETYYDPDAQGPETILFQKSEDSQGDYDALLAGETALVTDLPEEPLQALADSGLWTPEPVTQTYGLLLNTLTEPLNNENVRLALHLAIDRQTVADVLGDPTARPAPGVVPYGVADYGERPAVEEPDEEPAIPDPNAAPPPEKPAPTCWDFRTHSLQVVTAEHAHEYEADRSYAQALLANAGYPGGSGFPEIEYIYVEHSALDGQLAVILQSMWRESLGISVKPRAVSESEYAAALVFTPPEEEGESEGEDGGTEGETLPVPAFQIAAQVFSPACSDAEVLLRQWHSGRVENVTGYANDAFDILLDSAKAAVSPEARDAYLHDAEAILLEDSPVIPVLCLGGSYRLADGLTGMYRAPDSVFFLYHVRAESPEG